jgi:triacylglycerol lipase
VSCTTDGQNYPMPSDPARTTDVAALAIDYGERLIVGTIRDVHQAVARRVFGATRMVGGRVPESVHDSFISTVYGAISGALRISSASIKGLATRGIGRPVEESKSGRSVVAAVNGLIGDELRMVDDPQAIVMAVRKDGSDVPVSPWPIEEAFRGASSHVVIFLHGLCENEESWSLGEKATGSTYAQRLRDETDATPVFIRYNTGLRVSENGKHLDWLLRQLVDSWPTDVTRITLVGHSMGGLVARAATNHATASGQTWQHLVRDVVCLGTPHTGAALEKVAHMGSRVLHFFPESRPFGSILNRRSGGILDLRHGYITREEWEGQDLTRMWGLDRIAAAPLPHAEYHFVIATMGPTKRSPFSAALGDLLVHFSSAAGLSNSGPVVEGARLEYLPSTHHFALLNHPKIADWLVLWLNGREAAALPAGSAS